MVLIAFLTYKGLIFSFNCGFIAQIRLNAKTTISLPNDSENDKKGPILTNKRSFQGIDRCFNNRWTKTPLSRLHFIMVMANGMQMFGARLELVDAST